MDGEFLSLSDELSAGVVGRRVRSTEHNEALEDPLARRDLGLGRLNTLKVGLDHLYTTFIHEVVVITFSGKGSPIVDVQVSPLIIVIDSIGIVCKQ